MLFKFASCSRSFVVLRIVVLRELFAFVRLFDDDHSLDRPCALSSQHPARSFELFLVVLRELVVCARSFALIVLRELFALVRLLIVVRLIVRAHHHHPPARSFALFLVVLRELFALVRSIVRPSDERIIIIIIPLVRSH